MSFQCNGVGRKDRTAKVGTNSCGTFRCRVPQLSFLSLTRRELLARVSVQTGGGVVVISPLFGACEVHVPDVNVQLAQTPVPGKAERESLLFAVPARVTFIVHRGRRSGLVSVPDDEALRIGTSVSIGLGLLSNILHVLVGGSHEQGIAKGEAHHTLAVKPDVSNYCSKSRRDKQRRTALKP